MFDFVTSGRILFGAGKIAELPSIIGSNKKVLLITGKKYPPSSTITELLDDSKIDYEKFIIRNEPTIQDIHSGVEISRHADCDCIVSFGGGSVLDAGKAIAAFTTNTGDITDYLEVIGTGKKLTTKPIFHVAIPTTAGTGTEVTKNAVITSVETKVKVSLRNTWLLPDVAVIDPALTVTLPPRETANSGMDALSQLIEPYVSLKANEFTDMICVEGIKRISRSLITAYENGNDLLARKDMSFASLLGGLALANAGLGAIHGLAGPIGGQISAPHGAVCAQLLPFVIQKNIESLLATDPSNKVIRRYFDIFDMLRISGDSFEEKMLGLKDINTKLSIQPLSSYGMTKAHIPELIEMALRSSSMKANPIQLTPDAIQDILYQAL